MTGIYLLHFDEPYKHARHYTGWAKDIEARLRQHRDGNGSRLMSVIAAAGITWRLARVWEGADRNRERSLKNSGAASRYCPVCRPMRGVPAVPQEFTSWT